MSKEFPPIGDVAGFGSTNPERATSTKVPTISAGRIIVDIGRFGRVASSQIDVPELGQIGAHFSRRGDLFIGGVSADDTSSPFRVDYLGNLTATSASISGAITAASIDIPGVGIAGFHVDGTGNLGVGGTTSLNGLFEATAAGAVSATGITIDGTVVHPLVVKASGTAGLTIYADASGGSELVALQAVRPGVVGGFQIVANNGATNLTLTPPGSAAGASALLVASNTGTLSLGSSSVFTIGRTGADTAALGSGDTLTFDGGSLGTSLTASGPFVAAADAYITGTVSPAAIAAQADDYAPAGIATASRLRVTLTGNQSMTSLAASQTDGRTIVLVNIDTTDTLTLVHTAGAGTASNRFLCPNNVDYLLYPRQAVVLNYDGTSSRWRLSASAEAGLTAIATDTIWDAKGDIVTGSGADTAVKTSVGANDTILMADSAAAGGVKWVADAAPVAVGTGNSAGTSDDFSRASHVHAHEAAHINHDTTWAAKGDLIVASANDTASVVTVGADDTILMADAAAGNGVKWVAPVAPVAVGTANAAGSSDDFSRGSHVHAHETGHVVHDTIWDAKGDLAKGTAADTADVLAIGATAGTLRVVAGTIAWDTASTATPAAISTSGSAGTSANPSSHDDHVHAHEAAHINHDTTWAAKGDIITATANDTAAVTTVGANDTILMADSAAAGGVKWVADATPAAIVPDGAAAAGTSDDFSRASHAHGIVTYSTAATTTGTAAAGTSGEKPARGDHVHALEAHGASKHTDITRSVWLNAEAATLDSGTFATLGTAPDSVRAVAMADAATQGAFWVFAVPSDWTSGVITAQPYWVPGSTDASSHSVRWTLNTKSVAAGSDVTAASTSAQFTGASAARTANLLVKDTATSTTVTPAAAGDQLQINLRRVGGNANDTYVGTVNVTGVLITYTAEQ